MTEANLQFVVFGYTNKNVFKLISTSVDFPPVTGSYVKGGSHGGMFCAADSFNFYKFPI